jgi:hypothetical protein
VLYIRYVTLSMLLFIINNRLRVVCAWDYQQTFWPPPLCSHLKCKQRECRQERNTGSGCTRYTRYISHLFCITNYLTGIPPTLAHENKLRHPFSRVVDTAATTTRPPPLKTSSALVFEGGDCLLPPETRREGGNSLLLCFLRIQTRWEGVYPFSSCLLPHRRDERGKTSPVVFPSDTDVMRGGNPFPSCYLPHGRDTEGRTLSVL